MSVGNLAHDDDGERDAAVYHLDKAKRAHRSLEVL